MAKTIALAILHQGLVRRHNEDNLYILDRYVQAAQSLNFEKSSVSSKILQLYAVADGTGGGGIGDAASRAAMEALDQQRRCLRADSFDFETFARETADLANQAVSSQLAAYEGLQAGTTFSLLAVWQDAAYTVSLGDSRIYLFRGNNLTRLTDDHISRLPDHHQMSRHIGFLTDSATFQSDNITCTPLQPGDILLLLTGGVTKVLEESRIAAELAAPAAYVQTIHRLRDLVLQSGGRENMALVAVKILDPKAAPPPQLKKRSRQMSDRLSDWLGTRRARQATGDCGAAPRPRMRPRTFFGPPVKSHGGIGQAALFPKWLRILLFYLFFVIIGIALGRVIFMLPAIARWLASFG